MQRFTALMPFLMATSTFGSGRRRWSSPQQCYLHCLRTLFNHIYTAQKKIHFYITHQTVMTDMNNLHSKYAAYTINVYKKSDMTQLSAHYVEAHFAHTISKAQTR